MPARPAAPSTRGRPARDRIVHAIVGRMAPGRPGGARRGCTPACLSACRMSRASRFVRVFTIPTKKNSSARARNLPRHSTIPVLADRDHSCRNVPIGKRRGDDRDAGPSVPRHLGARLFGRRNSDIGTAGPRARQRQAEDDSFHREILPVTAVWLQAAPPPRPPNERSISSPDAPWI